MAGVVLQIVGHALAVEGDCAERFLLSYEGAAPFIVSGVAPQWTVRYGAPLPPADNYGRLTVFNVAETGGRCCFSSNGDSYRFTMTDSSSDTLLVDMRYVFGETSLLASECSDISALRFSLWFAVSMLTAFSRLTFVHSSAVVFNGKAVLFLGESGTGKSTHARLWLQNISGSHLLNDDSPMLSLDGGCAEVYGSPWSGKTPCYHNRCFPLAAIVRLSQAPHNSIRRLSVLESFAALQPSLPPALMQDDRFADLLNDFVSDAVSAVPIYALQCLPDPAAAHLCFETVFSPQK